MAFVSFEQAYFDEAGIHSSVSDVTFALPDQFTFEFPASFVEFSGTHVDSYAFWMDGTKGTLSDVGSVTSRTYQFSVQAGYYYRDSPYMTGEFRIYRVDIKEFGDEVLPDSQVEDLGYIYVYSMPTGSRSIDGSRRERYTFYFLPASELPPGLSYDYTNEVITPSYPDGIMNWFYDFGNSVYNFFPRLEDVLNVNILGSSFIWLLTQGFFVYCGWVVIKFVVDFVP